MRTMRNLRNNTLVCALIIYFVSVSAISAAAGQNSISGSEFCAEREVLLMVLLEAQGSPNGVILPELSCRQRTCKWNRGAR